MEQIEGTRRAALVEMRRLLGVLRKDDEGRVQTPQPGTQTLDMLVNRAQEAGLDVRVAIEGERQTLPPGVDVSVFRIIQEALTNSLKHAGRTRADVLLKYDEHGNRGRDRRHRAGQRLRAPERPIQTTPSTVCLG